MPKRFILSASITLALIIGLGLYFHDHAKAYCSYCPLPGGFDDTGPCSKTSGRADSGQLYRCSSNCWGCNGSSQAPCTCIVVQCYVEGPNPNCKGQGDPTWTTDYCYNCGPRLCPCDYW